MKLIYEKDGRVKIGTAKPEQLMGMMGYDDLHHIATEVQNILIEAIDEAV